MALLDIQLTPALTDFKGPTISICYRRISVIANIENKEKHFKRLKNSFCYRWISVTGGSIIAGFICSLEVTIKCVIWGISIRNEGVVFRPDVAFLNFVLINKYKWSHFRDG